MKKTCLFMGLAIFLSGTALFAGLTVASPALGTRWHRGTIQPVTFTTDTAYGDIYLLLYRNGVKLGFVKCGFPSGVPAGTYTVNWKVGYLTGKNNCSTPLTVPPNTGYIIRFSTSPTGSGFLAHSKRFRILS